MSYKVYSRKSEICVPGKFFTLYDVKDFIIDKQEIWEDYRDNKTSEELKRYLLDKVKKATKRREVAEVLDYYGYDLI